MRSQIVVFLALLMLLLTGCDFDKRMSLSDCMKQCSGPDCLKACGDTVAKAYGVDKENEHVFRWDHALRHREGTP